MNYKGHCITNMGILLGTVYTAHKLMPTTHENLGAYMVGFALGTLILSPDLDTFSRPYKNWGVLRFIWWPYQKSLKHRSWLTHGPLIGTLLRSVYLLLVCALTYSLIIYLFKASEIHSVDNLFSQYNFNLEFSFTKNINIIAYLFIGLEISALGHLLADKASDFIKLLRYRF